MGFSILTVKFIRRIHQPTRNNEYMEFFPRFLFSLLNYSLISIIPLDEFFNTAFNIQEGDAICVPFNLPLFDERELKNPFEDRSLENLYKKFSDRFVGETLRRELIYYGMV